jgi:lysine 2,3-aminomutase
MIKKFFRKIGVPDPLNENKFTVFNCLVHKYENRVLFELTGKCVHKCEFCSRNWKFKEMKSDFSDQDINLALDYISKNKKITEVVISGGDPLMVPKRLMEVMNQLEKMEHIEVIRIHTRLPLIDPKSFDKKILNFFKNYKKIIYLSLHAENFSELNSKNIKLIGDIRKTGVVLYSQTVFLKGINDNVLDLEKLFNGLLKIGVRPYLIYHCDGAKGTEKFWVDIDKERKIMAELRNKISGLACPTHVVDSYKGKGKVIVPSLNWNCKMSSFRDFDGNKITKF